MFPSLEMLNLCKLVSVNRLSLLLWDSEERRMCVVIFPEAVDSGSDSGSKSFVIRLDLFWIM